MKAIKEIRKVNNNKIILELPDDYLNKKVEIIILECEEEQKDTTDNFFYGCLKGKVKMSSDFNAPLEEFMDYM